MRKNNILAALLGKKKQLAYLIQKMAMSIVQTKSKTDKSKKYGKKKPTQKSVLDIFMVYKLQFSNQFS